MPGHGPVWLIKTIANHAALSGRHNLDAWIIVARSKRCVKYRQYL
jgi:hypothetical protein